MAEATLITHLGGRDVTLEELDGIPTPPSTETWFPIPHAQVLHAVEETLQGGGFLIQRRRLSIAKGGNRFFGTLDLSTPITDGVTLAVGVRNSTDKSFPIGFCCGTRVFVCDNFAFTSEIVVAKKHTRFGQERYLEGIARAVSSLSQYRESTARWIDQMKGWQLPAEAADSFILRSSEEEVIGARQLPLVLKEWRQPRFEEYQPRTAWSLFNSFTDVLGRTRENTHPAQAALTTMRLRRLLAPSEEIGEENVQR